MTLLSSKTFPQTGFIFPQLQLQAPKGILPFASGSKETQGKKKKTYPRTGVSCGQKKPPLLYQNWSPEARAFANTGHSDSRSTGPGPSDWRLLTRWPLLAGCRLRPALPAAGRARAPRVLPPLAAALFRAAAERPPQARRRRRRRSERVGRSPERSQPRKSRSLRESWGRRGAALPIFRTNSDRGFRDRPIAKEWPDAEAETEDTSRRMQELARQPRQSDPPGCPGCRARAGPRPPRVLRARLVPTARRWSLGAAGGEGAGVGGGSPGAGGAAGSAADPSARAGRQRNK